MSDSTAHELAPTCPGCSVPELSTVYVEHPVSSAFLGDREHLTQYNSAFEHLSAVALPPIALQGERKCYTERDSLQLIQHLLYTL
ncbi:Scr1 family TA system antitoxin-like transcriptional regulator [Streptomyces endocoffeicus]|uniref:Scr1 family TA system antitoxin-like transcriptional regulator n=1 Tax=Streptomyces endocoffeicus TaxID=2898945 RepID=UPI001E5FD1DD|nr:Scr1 family TA system antitoxin-like transcriptional regulator [Streptomyces endocoffeicus]